MKLNYIPLTENYHHYAKLKHLFEHAFPAIERPPFSVLISFKKDQIFGAELQGQFVGLISYVIKDDLLYLFFLAVKKKYRVQGIGSQIIRDIFTEYPDKRIFLLAEDPSIPSENQEERKNRINFYQRNGLFMGPVRVNEYEVEYALLDNHSNVGKNDFLSVMEYLLEDYYPIYRNNVH